MKNLTDECLPTKLKEEFVKVKNLFLLLKKKDSFEVDFLRGRIVLFSGIKDIQIDLSLKEQKNNKEFEEESIFSQFNDEISELQFPEFGGEG